jgi:excisionase family DNA binding protein
MNMPDIDNAPQEKEERPMPHKTKNTEAESTGLHNAVTRSYQLHFPEIMTIDQAAEYLQLHRQVLYRYVRENVVPAVRLGGTIRFKKSVLDAFLEQHAWDHVKDFVAFAKRKRKGASKAEGEQETKPRRFSADID